MSGRQSLRRGVASLAFALACLLASCASPPLTIYTLGAPAAAVGTGPLGQKTMVIEVRRVSVPDFLDSQDILVRDGNVLVRSTQGRWATRLSLEATYFLTSELARRRPDALVTDQQPIEPPNDRIFVTISRLDVTSAGTATLDADWQIVPRDPKQPVRRGRAQFTSSGPVATDQDVVTLTKAVLAQLAEAIDVPSLR
jgi:uncharacterized lipoprotein YmbA